MSARGARAAASLRRGAAALGVAALASWPVLALAQPRGRGAAAAAGGADDLLSRPLALVVALALVSLLPFFLMVTTSFVKASTTLQIVRSAIGAQGVPSNTVVMALAAALSLMAMAPVVDVIAERARPLVQAERPPETGPLVVGIVDAVREPMRAFLRANASPRERARFLEVARRARPEAERERVGADDLVVLVPAFMTTELYEAFLLGFAVFLPFLVVDLVVANVLLALGMQQLQPTQVSLPFKLFLFVAVDGWGLLAQALVSGYQAG
ncbi:MAG TPA: EscR/YscR/HrcR family type III secretion system export apparatus protein [Polyangiaceae bacterium]|nr:EscR/YscR/HrcR family type III secretion system export apparatus protein [Polyangiaceae bacterium]